MKNAERLEKLALPALPASREELVETLRNHLFGHMPPPTRARAVVEEERTNAYTGKATVREINVSFDTPNGEFSFPATVFIPTFVEKPKVFVHICFRIEPYRHIPVEEIIDNGYALAVVRYSDIASDDDDFTCGLAAKYPRVTDTDWGKIGMWAYGMQRLIDVLEDWDLFSDFAVLGHSRLGKTALWCGATDARISLAVSNNSGCSGAALARGERRDDREDVGAIVERFPFWFCKNYWRYANNEAAMPFDQHWLIAANAPHKVLVNSAQADLWADPNGEYLACVAASAFYEAQGMRGLVSGDELPPETCYFGEGNIGYTRRPGSHCLSRIDWNSAMRFWRE